MVIIIIHIVINNLANTGKGLGIVGLAICDFYDIGIAFKHPNLFFGEIALLTTIGFELIFGFWFSHSIVLNNVIIVIIINGDNYTKHKQDITVYFLGYTV
mgnify:CR=1 FL=1